MRINKITVLFISLVISSLSFAQSVVIIVNAENPATSLTKDAVQDYYFKRIRHWPDGNSVRFFDRQDNSVRDLFFEKIINKTTRQVDQYWIGQKFNTGDSAPTQVTSDSLTIGLVSKFPGGIGYVTEGTTLPKEVKTIELVVK